MRLNILGCVAAILAFVSILLPWWGMSASLQIGGEIINPSLRVHPWGIATNLTAAEIAAAEIPEIANITSALGVDEEVVLIPSWIWYVPTAMALVIVGAVLGLVGSSMTERKGKIFLASAGILMVLSAVIFVVGLSSDTGELLFENRTGFSTYFSLGFLQALVAAVFAFFSLAAEPRSPVMPRLKMKRIEVLLSIVFIIFLYGSIVFAMIFDMLSVSVVLILLDFLIAMIIAIVASLSVREEEEEKTMPVTTS